MAAQHWHWLASGAALLVMVFSGVAEHRRSRRSRLDDIGWVPWRGIQVVAVFGLLLVLILSVKGI